MARSKGNLRRAAASYMDKTHRPMNCLLFVVPMLVAYEVGALFFGHQLLAIKHLGEMLRLFGATGRFLPPILLIFVLLAWHVVTKQRWHADGGVMLGMGAESMLWVVPMLLLHAVLVRLANLWALSGSAGGKTIATEILTGIGAGVYEEFLFRLAGIGLFLMLTVDLVHGPKRPMAIAAVILTSVLFSLYHFVGPDRFSVSLFVFRALAGAYLAAVYITRGFGVAVGAHACYNALVVLGGPAG